MHWWLVVASERLDKQGRVASSLHAGLGPERSTIVRDDPPDPTKPFIAIGQMWVVPRIVPPAMKRGQPFWLVDNGYHNASGKGNFIHGYYEFTYRGLVPIVMDKPDYTRFPARDCLQPWRPLKRDGYVLLGYPGPSYGKMLGMDMQAWGIDMLKRLREMDVLVRERDKFCARSLESDLAGARVVVTHSSHIAIDAVRRGIPAIVAPTNPAAPVCSTTLDDLNNPPMPDREKWWASLMCQQFSHDDMRRGVAYRFMQQVMEQVDGS